ncbi:MAG: TonB-dependent receptor domain-containing protein [Terriglobales bacterium]
MLLLVLALSLLTPASLLAQLGSGQIEGTVTDPNGAVVSGAKITLMNTETGIARELTTGDSGGYRATALQPGIYNVKAEAQGFSTKEQKGITVTVGSTTTVDISLAVGSAQDTVTVESTPPTVDTEKTDVSSTIDKNVVENVPVVGRRWDNYVLQSPGVVTDGTFGLISYRGVSGLYNNNTVDGVDNNQAFFSEARGRTRAVSTYSQAAVQEFQVSLSNPGAEFGRAAGGMINAVTKSGTNGFHGQAFYNIRDSATGAADPFAAAIALAATGNAKVPERRQQYGFAMGGPIKKDKLFWFLNYDEQHRTFPYVVLTESGTFLPPATGAGSCTDVLVFPTAQQQTNCTTTRQFFLDQQVLVPRKAPNNVAFGKLDWTINPAHSISGSYNYHQWRGSNNIRTPLINFNAASDNGIDRVRTDSVLAKWTYIVSPTILNELRFQFGRDNESQVPNAPGPSTTVTNGLSFGQPDFLPRAQYPFEDRYQWVESLSMVRGSHTFKFGADINYVRDRVINLFRGGGVYSYTNFANLAGDCPPEARLQGCVPDGTRSYSTYRQAFDNRVIAGSLSQDQNGFASFETTDWNFYAQDTYKLRSNITLNLGVRYEYQRLPQPSGGNPAFPLTQSFPQDTNNFGPRVGFAWDIDNDHRTVLSAGYSLVYGRTSNSAIYSGLLNNGIDLVSATFFSGAVPGPQGPVYPDCFEPAVNADCTLPSPVVAIVPDINQFAADFQRPMIHQAQASLEHEVAKDTVLSLTYNYSGGRNLPIFRDVNLFDPLNEVFINLNNNLVAPDGTIFAPAGVYGPFPFYCDGRNAVANNCGTTNTTLRPSTAAARVLQEESLAESSYHAMIVKFRRSMNRGISFNAHFTWAHAIDNGQNSTTFFSSFGNSYDPLNLGPERARSIFDLRRRFVANFVWRPDRTWGISGDVKRKLLGGWQFSGAVYAQDGKPVNGSLSGSLTGANTRPVDTTSSNGSGGNNRLPFVVRNFGEAPGLAIFDFRLSRSFNVTEGTRIELIAESFNLFNRLNITTVGTTAASLVSNVKNVTTCGGQTITLGNRCLTIAPSASFLEPRSASSNHNGPREFQFAARFFW